MANVYTYKNTSFDEWMIKVADEFKKMKINPIGVTRLRYLHAYEGGDTPYAWCDHLVRQAAMQKRTRDIKRDNP
jgi:hypothetical protein